MSAYSSVAEQIDPMSVAKTALCHTVYKLMVPVVRVMLRYGMPFQSFAAIAKKVYVDVAKNELKIPNKTQTKSRIALLTGLSRPDVHQILMTEEFDSVPNMDKFNRVIALIGAWDSDPKYLDDDGKPKELPVKALSGEPTFMDLVKQVGADIGYSTLLDELVSSGHVIYVDKNTVKLERDTYIPAGGSTHQLKFLGKTVHRLLSTITHNILNIDENDENSIPFYQQEAWTRALPPHKLKQFRKKLRDMMTEFQKKAIEYMGTEEELPPDYHHVTAGIGLYYFED